MADRRVIIIIEDATTPSTSTEASASITKTVEINSPPTPADRWHAAEALRDALCEEANK